MDNDKLNYTLKTKTDSLNSLTEKLNSLTDENRKLQSKFDSVSVENKNLQEALQDRAQQVDQLRTDLESVKTVIWNKQKISIFQTTIVINLILVCQITQN